MTYLSVVAENIIVRARTVTWLKIYSLKKEGSQRPMSHIQIDFLGFIRSIHAPIIDLKRHVSGDSAHGKNCESYLIDAAFGGKKASK